MRRSRLEQSRASYSLGKELQRRTESGAEVKYIRMPTYDYYTTYTARTNPISQYINTNSCTATSWTWPTWAASTSAETACSTGPDYRIYTNLASQDTDYWTSKNGEALATMLERLYMNHMNDVYGHKKELEKDVDENKLIDLLDQ